MGIRTDMSRLMDIYDQLRKNGNGGATAAEIGEQLQIDRTTASRYLNDLVKANHIEKIAGKPVRYAVHVSAQQKAPDTNVIGSGESLQPILETGMAAFLYPSRPLPILLTGETGTGKSYLAEKLSNLTIANSETYENMPFIAFNCADYAQNPELLVGQIFGIKKGAFTGATEDKMGLVEQADGGILFLDEIHRLPPSGQEMLFYLIDKGIYHRLGEATQEREASIALIGATTEDSETHLLPTLLRRFSVKLNVPSLRERTDKEREALIDHFLSDEAAKMNATLSIEEDCREAFLGYDCPGNIGQLKSDIQIACARAYLRYLNKQETKVLVKLEDFPGEKKFVEQRYRNERKASKKIAARGSAERAAYPFPNIYQRLDQKTNEENADIQKAVLDYIRELTQKYKQPSLSQESWQHLMDDDLFQVLQDAADELNAILPFQVHQSQLYVIGLHLQNYRNYLRKDVQKAPIPVMIHPNATYREAAGQLASRLSSELGMGLPQEEVELIAHFLTPEQKAQPEVAQEQEIAVILVTHGTSTATSMAQVTNYLLGNNVIHAVDMPLNVSAEETYERVKQTINNLSHSSGALLLVDIGSLITMGDTIQEEVHVPIRTLSSVNLPMVLEAGRQSLISGQTLDGIYTETKNAFMRFVENDQQTASDVRKKRLIATVCFTGEGAAQLLESWIENQLSEVDQDVLIRSVRIDPVTKDTSVLTGLKDYYDVIAIIGTVPVSIDGIPYIPAWELLQHEGISRMHKLLEITRKSALPNLNQDVSRDEIYELITHGLQEIVTNVNPKSIANLLQEYIPSIRDFYGWNNNRELGMWMHIGGLIDRIIAASLQQNDEQFLSSIPLDNQTVLTAREKELWNPFCSRLEETFHIHFPDEIKRELAKLSR
ncbi:sigma-54-dependent transcriptional regulator [Lentibacillus lipolyticus]|nr:sigma-54-dependent transcriptional regulator [Lentibacillus lipolyticus]